MPQIEKGNALDESKATRGWFVGAFINKLGLQKTSDIEIKYGKHPQGEGHTSQAGPGDATSIGLLVSGEYGIKFEDQAEIVLDNEGDYVIWNPNIPHSTHAYADTLLITIRWPSLSAGKK